MKTIFKSFKFRIYPDKEQEILLAKHFGACRFVFNHYLNKRKESYLGEDKKSLNYYDNANDLTQFKKDENYIWLGSGDLIFKKIKQHGRHILPGVFFTDLNLDDLPDVGDSTTAMNRLLEILPDKFKLHIL